VSRALVVLLFAVGSSSDLVLPIPDRPQHPQSPPSGWCGETAIQEALLHFGIWAPQSKIHKSGNPKHPDLYSDEIPTALAGLGVSFAVYPAKEKGFAPYRAWVREGLERGQPTVAGVKILPTAHPDWGLDHFVLAVGEGKKGLLVNTTWDQQQWADDKATKGISFAGAFYGLRILGPKLPKGAGLARLEVLAETAKTVRLRVACVDAEPSKIWRIERRSGSDAGAPEASTPGSSLQVELDPAVLTRFRCVSE
jgi:hypothetical protein